MILSLSDELFRFSLSLSILNLSLSLIPSPSLSRMLLLSSRSELQLATDDALDPCLDDGSASLTQRSGEPGGLTRLRSLSSALTNTGDVCARSECLLLSSLILLGAGGSLSDSGCLLTFPSDFFTATAAPTSDLDKADFSTDWVFIVFDLAVCVLNSSLSCEGAFVGVRV